MSSGSGGTKRIDPLPVADFGEPQEEALRGFLGEEGLRHFVSDRPDAPRMPNVLGTLLRHPALAGPWLTYNDVLLRKGALDPRLRELAILRVAWETASEYEWLQHVRLAGGLGIGEAEIEALAGRGTWDWPPVDALVLEATGELLDSYVIGDETWRRLREHFDETQMMELVFVVGSYTCLAMAFKSFGVALDPDLVDLRAPRPLQRLAD